MLEILFSALCRMRHADFFQGAPGNPCRMTEAPTTHNLLVHLREVVRQAPLNQHGAIHYDIQKSAREFHCAFRGDWVPLQTRYRDLFGDGDQGSVRPDICVHNPHNIHSNDLAVEVKCNSINGFKIYHDFRKLRLDTDPNGLQFTTAVFLHFGGAVHGPVETLRRWSRQNPRPVSATAISTQLAQAAYLATPTPVANYCYHVWHIPRFAFNNAGTLDAACIRRLVVTSAFVFGEEFVDQDYPL